MEGMGRITRRRRKGGRSMEVQGEGHVKEEEVGGNVEEGEGHVEERGGREWRGGDRHKVTGQSAGYVDT